MNDSVTERPTRRELENEAALEAQTRDFLDWCKQQHLDPEDVGAAVLYEAHFERTHEC